MPITTDKFILPKHRHGDNGPGTTELGEANQWPIALGISTLRRDVVDMGHLLRPNHAAQRRLRVWANNGLAAALLGPMLGGALCRAPQRNLSPSRSHMIPNLASQRRVAFSSMA